ncbi:hypothetical protein TYRP_001137, partial [Tyrophagus putrescentiae]
MEGVVSSEERELQTLKEKFTLMSHFADSLKTQLTKAEEQLQKARNENFQLSLTSEAAKSQNDTLQHENKSLANAKVELVQLLEREKDKVARLKETISNIESFNSQSQASTLNCSTLNDIKLKEIELQFKEKRFNSERNFHVEQIKQMSDELESKNAELLELRKKLNISTMQANLKLEQQSAEITSCHLENNRLKAIVDNNQTAHEELKKKYAELQANCASFESNFSKEIDAQTEVINMLMKQTEDLKSQLSARDSEIEVFRDISKKGYEAHTELEATFEEMKNSYMKDVAELEAERDRLLEELEKLKQETSAAKESLTKRCIENEFKKAFPLAYENAQQLNGVVSLSDIHQQMTRLKQERDTLEAENARLSAQLEEMEARVNDDKPVMYRNMQNYKQLAESYASLEKNLLILMSEKQSLEESRDHDTRQIHSLQREVKRYEVECNNLSIQIQHLMRSLVEVQEGYSINTSFGGNHSGQQEQESSNGGGPIPANMITFRDIQSCQEQNRNLMRYIHSLVEGDEAALKSDERLASLTAELDNCKKEVERLQSKLAERSTAADDSFQRSRHGDFSSSSAADAAETKALRAKVDQYQLDMELCRQQHLEQVRRLDAEKNNLISENLENANVTLEKLEQENSSLRERNIKLNSTIEHLEKSIIYLKSEIEAAKQSLKDAETKVAVSRSERDVMKNAELSLIQENAHIREELENHKRIVYQLQAIQANNQESERESIRSLQMQCEHLKANTEFYQKKAASDEEKWANSIAAFTNQINNLQSMLEKEKNGNVEWQRKYFELQQQLNQQLEKGAAAFAQQAAAGGSDGSNLIPSADQKRQIAHLQDEIKVLKGKLANSEASCESLKAFNASLEENLAQMVAHNDETRVSIERELQSKADAIRQLEQEIEAARQSHETIVAEKNAQELKQLLAEAKVETRKAQETEQSLQDDLTYQKVITAKLQEDYEAEAALRSTDATTIIGLKLQLEMLQTTAREREAEVERLKEQVASSAQSLESRIKELGLENEKLQLERSELKGVNEVLLNQTEQLNNQLIALQSNSSLFAQDESTQKENASQMAGVVKFYREENAQLQAKLSELNDEHSRLKIELDNCLKEIESFKSALEAERQSTARLSNSNEYKELFAKAELVPVLTENTSQMRIELSKLEQRNRELMEQVAKLELGAKEVSELSSRAEGEVVEKQFLRNEIEQWKAKASALTQQLKSFDSESVKRVMAEKTHLSKAIQSLTLEKEKLAASLEQANRQIQEDANEKAQLQAQSSKLQKINTQLRNLALKYKNAASAASSSSPSTSAAPSFVSSDTSSSVATSAPTMSASSSQQKQGSSSSSLPTVTVSSVTPQTSVLPLATKTTPTASIKPLIDANAGKTVPQRVISRPVTVVQPTATAEESPSTVVATMMSSQQATATITATVQPTQPQQASTSTAPAETSAAEISSATAPSTSAAASRRRCGLCQFDMRSHLYGAAAAAGAAAASSAAVTTGEDSNNSKRSLDDAADEPSTSSNLTERASTVVSRGPPAKKFKSTEEEDYGGDEE